MERHPPPPERILFLLSSLGVGGSERKTVRLANDLAGRGISVTIAYLSPPKTLIDEVSPSVSVLHLERRGKFSLHALMKLIRALRTGRVQVVVAVNPYPALYAKLAQLCIGSGLRFVACVNTTDFLAPREARQMPLYRRVLRSADGVIFGAAIQQRLWRERYGIGGERGSATTVIHNGVDTSHFEPRSEWAVRERERLGLPVRFILGTVGQMRPEKAQAGLIRATAALRARGLEVGALIVGDGVERPRIEAEIARLGLRRFVALAGEVRDVRPALAAMDVFVLTSIAVETFSNAALEAMASGIPVVTSSIGGMPELVAHGGGICYPPGDEAALEAALADLLQSPPRLQRMKEEARRAAAEHFSWNGMADAFLAAIATAGSRGGGDPTPVARRPIEELE